MTDHPATDGVTDGPGSPPRAPALGPVGWRRLLAFSLLAGLVAFMSVRALMQAAPPSITDLDLSWQLSLGVALAHHLQFGKAYLFTYGPLGFLHVSMAYPSHLLAAIAAVMAVLMLVLYALALLLFADRVGRRRVLGRPGQLGLLAAATGVALLTAIAANLGTVVEVLALVCLLTGLTASTRRLEASMATLGGLCLAFGALFKTDLLAVALAELLILVLATPLLSIRRWRAAAFAITGFLVSYLLLWIACGQNPVELPAFWLGSWELSLGYSSAMALASDWTTVAALTLLAMALGLTPILLRSRWRQPVTVQEVAIVISVPFMFVSWKDALVRIDGPYDGRALALFGVVLGVGWLVTLASPKARPSLAAGPAVACVLAAAFMVNILLATSYRPWAVRLLEPHPPAPTTLLPSQDEIPTALTRQLRGYTVNDLPWSVAYVVDNHLTWDPLPEPQTYSAYTPYLDRIDAAQINSSGAAQRLVVSLIDIDARYLFWDPPLVWDAVLSRYRCIATSDISAVLALRPPTTARERLTGVERGHFGQWLALPASAARSEFVDLAVSSSLEGQAASFVLRQSPLYATLRLSNGTTVGPVRIIAATANDGLYISHFITTPAQLCQVLGGRAGGVPAVTAIELTSAHPSQWDRAFTARVLVAS